MVEVKEIQASVFLKSATLLAVALALPLALPLAGCGRRPAAVAEPPDAAAPGYAAPPTASGLSGQTLTGMAEPGAKVRLNSPGGAALETNAGADGLWRLALPPSPEPRIFGVSETTGGRRVQGQGYVLVDPGGKAAVLRAGAGALRLDPRPSPALTALDYDAAGGAVISGTAPAQSLVFLKLDGRQLAEAKADAGGRYTIALAQPLERGVHTIEVSGDAFKSAARAEVSRPAPLVAGPLRRQLVTGGLRADWLTPGGGVQTTLLFD